MSRDRSDAERELEATVEAVAAQVTTKEAGVMALVRSLPDPVRHRVLNAWFRTFRFDNTAAATAAGDDR